MIKYGCGHVSKGMIIMDSSAPAMAHYMVWQDSTGFDGDKSECFDCFLKRIERDE